MSRLSDFVQIRFPLIIIPEFLPASFYPLRSFRVRLDDLAETVGREGRFVFVRIDPGTHLLVIRAEGLQHQKTVELPAGRTTLDIPIAFSGLSITVREEK